jgi:hypothetical protein
MTTLSTHLLPLFGRLADGNVLQLLSHDGFDAAAHLLPLERIVAHLKRLAGPPGAPAHADRLKVVARRNAMIVARRLLLGRYADELVALQNLWTTFGTPADVVLAAASGARTPRDYWSTPGRITFSAAHAAFVTALAKVELADERGPLGQAVRLSPYHGADRAERPGESLHTGFPAILGSASGLCSAVWVVPDAEDGWPAWENGDRDPALAKLCAEWDELHAGLKQMGEKRSEELSPVWQMNLPEWLVLHVLRSGGDAELPSAGLAVLMQCLAETRGESLPAGVGFTGRVTFGQRGRWEDVRVRGVNGIKEKALAAREAGIFLLFACRDGASGEPGPPVPGVQIAWIDPESALEEVLRKVNTICSESGITEYRRRTSATRVLERLRAAGTERGYASPLLPDALGPRSCPVGAAERVEELRELRQVRQQAKGRSLVFLVGGPRQGKTTLLSSWLFRSDDWPRLPAWYSLRRQSGATGPAAELRRAVMEQLEATHLVVRHPRHPDTLEALDRLTEDRVEVVIDGLDEVEPSQQIVILDFLRALSGSGIAVIGTQDIPVGYERAGAQVKLSPNLIAAYHVIDGFARKFLECSRSAFHDVGLCLSSPAWREGLARQAGGNPWVLKEFLSAIDEGHWGWPDSPEEARLTPDVRAYCGDVLKEVLAAAAIAPDAANVRALVNGLALLDDRPWPLADALFLLGLPIDPTDLARWQQTLAHRPLLRLLDISANGLQVRFRDATFREFFRADGDAIECGLLERMLSVLVSERLPDGTHLSLRDAAVREVAMHAIRIGEAAPHLVRRLLLETDWAFLRLRSLVDAGLSIGEMVIELVKLAALIRDQRKEERDAIDALRLSLLTWQEPIERGGADAAQWWQALAAVQQYGMWKRQWTGEVREASLPLLAPIGGEEGRGYQIQAHHIGHLGDAACELLDLTLVLTNQTGHLLLFPFDAATRRYGEPARRWTGMKEILQLTPLGFRQVLVLGIDHDERKQLRLVDLDVGSVRPWGPDADAARLFACEVLDVREGQGEPAVLLAGVEQGHIRVSIWRAGAEVASEVLPFGPFERYRQPRYGVICLSPTTWAAWGAQGDEEDRICRFFIQEWRGGKVIKIADHEVTEQLIDGTLGVCAGPDGQLALYYKTDGVNATMVAFDADGSMRDPLTLYPDEDSNVQDDETEYPAAIFFDSFAVVWHDRLGLIVNDDVDAFSIRPAPEVLLQELPEAWCRLPSFDLPRRGHRLAGGRVLLLYDTYGIVIEK